jgi:hypothetical protein
MKSPEVDHSPFDSEITFIEFNALDTGWRVVTACSSIG